MFSRRKFIQSSALGAAGIVAAKPVLTEDFIYPTLIGKPIVISTWDAGLRANKGAWNILSKGGRALDAVEAGVMVTEDEQSCCVGLGANPDRNGFVF